MVGLWLQATFTSATTLTMENVSATAQFYGKGMHRRFAAHMVSVNKAESLQDTELCGQLL